MRRRDFGYGLAGLAVLGVGSFGYLRFRRPWYAATPYDDLLHQIVDREPAAALGKTLPRQNAAALAAKLRQPGFALKQRARADGEAGRVVEAGGWLVPETLALYSTLAAQFA